MIRVAHASRVLPKASRLRFSVILRRKDPFRRDAETSTRDACATLQSAERAALVSRPCARLGTFPTPRQRGKSVLLFRSIPFSNSIDQKFRAPLSVIQAKSESRLCVRIQQDNTRLCRAIAEAQIVWRGSKGRTFRLADSLWTPDSRLSRDIH